MSRRVRSTWRQASAAPAIPTEAGGHPASQPQPSADKYETGNPSTWAEDPRKGPYPKGTPPAMPTEDGEHPARKQARQIAAFERRAMKCLRIATALLGKNASEDMLHDQSLAFMDLEDDVLDSTLDRMVEVDMYEDYDDGIYASEDEDEDEGDSDDEELDPETRKMLASMLRAAEDDDSDDEEVEASEDEDDDDLDPETRKMLAFMRREAEEDEDDSDEDDSEDDEDDSEDDEDEDEDEDVEASDDEDEDEDEDVEASDDEDEDDMDAEACDMDAADMLDDEVDAMDWTAADDEEEEEEVEVEAKKKASRTASTKLRPQPRKPSFGPKTLGNVRTASNSNISDLEKLWTSAPDVSKLFRS